MTNYTMKGFKKYLADNSNINLDFRSHVYLNNQYGLTPCFEYETAKTIILLLAEYTSDDSPIYNLNNSIDNLRITKLKDFINEWLRGANNV